MKFRQAFCGACTDNGAYRRNLGQRNIATNSEGWLVIVREIVRRIILFGSIFASRRMFMGAVVVVRMHGTSRTQLFMSAQVHAPRSTRHDKRAYEQDEGENAEHGAAITGRGA